MRRGMWLNLDVHDFPHDKIAEQLADNRSQDQVPAGGSFTMPER